MDLRHYYREIAEQEAKIEEAHVLVASKKTETGGRDGVISEVTRSMAARLIVEKSARLATAEEAAAYRDELARKQHEKQMAAWQEGLRLAAQAEEELRIIRQNLKHPDEGE